MTLLQAEDAVLAGQDIEVDRATLLAMLRLALRARNHFAKRVGQLRNELTRVVPVEPGDYPVPHADLFVEQPTP